VNASIRGSFVNVANGAALGGSVGSTIVSTGGTLAQFDLSIDSSLTAQPTDNLTPHSSVRLQA
jgi:hypothetical protein